DKRRRQKYERHLEDTAKSGTITMNTPRGSSQEARRRMAAEGVRRLHEWLQHQSVHEGQEEMEPWVPPPPPPEQRAKAKSWLPVYSSGVIVRWERAMAPEAAAETPAAWNKHLLTTTDRWESSIKLGSGGTDPDPNL
ncbi:Fubp1, partial [Symbiodinium necroappetens]